MARFAQKNVSVPKLPNAATYPGFHTSTKAYSHQLKAGLSLDVVQAISQRKNEPAWMLQKRQAAWQLHTQQSLPSWGPDLSAINFADIRYYLEPTKAAVSSWADVPDEVRSTFDRLGVPQAEQAVLAGVKAQYDSSVVYGSLQKQLASQGVIFLSMDEAVQQYPDLVQQYFGKLIPAGDNYFASLNTAVWSGGSFVYVPAGVDVKLPLQAYFRINAPRAGQFERTLIIVEAGARVHYVEGCSAPQFSAGSLHAAVVEIFVQPGAFCQYTTIQNWYKNVYNLVTKRARVEQAAEMIWTDCNLGSSVTMKYPSLVLAGEGARGQTLSIALAGPDQHQDTGSKAIHLAPHTSSTIISKSISHGGGRASYRGLVHVAPTAHHCQSTVICDALLLDPQSRSDTYPVSRVLNAETAIQHEATVSKVGEDQLFYLMSRGVDEATARTMIVRGFIDGVVRTLPLEYAVEMNRLIELEMEGSVG